MNTGWWVADYLRVDPKIVLYWSFWVIGSIVLHELGHGVAAIRCGDRTPIQRGHMTLNPLVHMGKWSLIAFALIGIAWGAMPVNPSRFRRLSDNALVAAVGPAVNLCLFAICVLGGAASSLLPSAAADLAHPFFRIGAILNMVLMLFNLLPIPPLDGSRILETYSQGYRQLLRHPQAGSWMMGAFFLIFFIGADYIFAFAMATTDAAINGLAGLF